MPCSRSRFQLDLELVYHDGRCVIVTASLASDDAQTTPDRGLVKHHSSQIRQFVCDNLEDAKKRGMAGFEFEPLIKVKELGDSDMTEDLLSQKHAINRSDRRTPYIHKDLDSLGEEKSLPRTRRNGEGEKSTRP